MHNIDETIKSLLLPSPNTSQINLDSLLSSPDIDTYILRIAMITKNYDYENKTVSILDFYNEDELLTKFKVDPTFAKTLVKNYLKSVNNIVIFPSKPLPTPYTYSHFFRTFLKNFYTYLNNMLNIDDSHIIMYDLLKRNFDFNGFVVEYYKSMENYLFLKKYLFSLIVADGYTYANYKFYSDGSISYLRVLDKTRKFINNSESLSNSEKATLLKYTLLLNDIRDTQKTEITEIQNKIKLELKKINPLYHLD